METKDILELQNQFLECLALGTGFQGLASQLAITLNKPAIITDTLLRVVGAAGCTEILAGHFLAASMDPATKQSVVTLEENSWDAFVSTVTGKNKKLLGYLFILRPEANPFLEIIAKQAALTCALEFVKHQETLAIHRQYKDVFIYDLLYSNIESVKDVISRGENWGWNLNLPHQVIVFELEDYQDFSSDQHLFDALYNLVEAVIVKHQQKPILMQKKGQIILLLQQLDPLAVCQKSKVEELIKDIRKSLEIRIEQRSLYAGVGRVYNSPVDIFRSYQEAKVALELSRIMKSQGIGSFFTDLGLARILYNHDQQELKEFYKETLGILAQFDLEQSNDLMDTLEKYLSNQCDLKATAKSLFLHPNTLRYRLKKIEEILQLSLDDFDTKLNLMTAFKIRYLGKV